MIDENEDEMVEGEGEAAGVPDAEESDAAASGAAASGAAASGAAASGAEASDRGDDGLEPLPRANAPHSLGPDDDDEIVDPDFEKSLRIPTPSEIAEEDSASAYNDDDEVNPADVEAEAPAWLDEVLEALILCSSDPLTPAKVREVLSLDGEDVPVVVIRRSMKELVGKWNAPDRTVGRGLRLVEVGGGVVIRTAAQTARFMHHLRKQKPARLSKAALETLAIISYRQPVTRPQMEDIRGVDCSGAVKNLLERGLIRVLGKADDIGRPLLYGTTRAFLEFFSIKALSDLPTLRELHELDGIHEPEALPDEADNAPVVVRDLFDPLDGGTIISSETEDEGEKAIAALEAALGAASRIERVAAALDDPSGEIPENWREAAAARESEREVEAAEVGADDEVPADSDGEDGAAATGDDDAEAPGAGESAEPATEEGAAVDDDSSQDESSEEGASDEGASDEGDAEGADKESADIDDEEDVADVGEDATEEGDASDEDSSDDESSEESASGEGDDAADDDAADDDAADDDAAGDDVADDDAADDDAADGDAADGDAADGDAADDDAADDDAADDDAADDDAADDDAADDDAMDDDVADDDAADDDDDADDDIADDDAADDDAAGEDSDDEASAPGNAPARHPDLPAAPERDGVKEAAAALFEDFDREDASDDEE